MFKFRVKHYIWKVSFPIKAPNFKACTYPEHMFTSPLIETLRVFTEDELKALNHFVHNKSLYHTDHQAGVIKFFDLILPEAPGFTNPENLDRHGLAKKLAQSPQYIAKVAANLHGVVRQFVAWHQQRAKLDEFNEQLHLLDFYRRKGLDQRFESLFNKLQQQLRESSTADLDQYWEKNYQLNRFKMEWMSERDTREDNYLRAVIDSFDAYYLLQRAQYTYQLLLRQQNYTFTTSPYLAILQQIEQYCLRTSPEESGLLLLYYEALLILVEREDEDFDRFQTLLQQYGSVLPQTDYHSLHGLERQVLLKQYRENQSAPPYALFELYQKHWEKGLLTLGGVIMPSVFANIVRYGCRCGAMSWVRTFLDSCEHKLGGLRDTRELFSLYSAYYYLHNDELEVAETHLCFDFEDALRKVDARCLELMILYQLGSPILEHKIDAFRKLVRNTKGLPEIRREGFHNFALSLRKMTNPDLTRNDRKIDKLIESIHTEVISEKFWLIEQLKKRKKAKGKSSSQA